MHYQQNAKLVWKSQSSEISKISILSRIDSDITIPKNVRYFRNLRIDTIGIECPTYDFFPGQPVGRSHPSHQGHQGFLYHLSKGTRSSPLDLVKSRTTRRSLSLVSCSFFHDRGWFGFKCRRRPTLLPLGRGPDASHNALRSPRSRSCLPIIRSTHPLLIFNADFFVHLAADAKKWKFSLWCYSLAVQIRKPKIVRDCKTRGKTLDDVSDYNQILWTWADSCL
jgi:hypothetical protein